MNSDIKKILTSTIDTYEQRSSDFIEAYDHADMSDFYRLLDRELSQGSDILDIGFGSGRDIYYLKEKGFNIWGVDPSNKFVSNAKKRFPNISDHFFTGRLPELNIPAKYQGFFDAILLVAVWMHLPKETYISSIESIKSLLKIGGKIILSYSTGSREKDERFFEQIDPKELQDIFLNAGFSKVSSMMNKDGLDERDIVWITEVYRYDKF